MAIAFRAAGSFVDGTGATLTPGLPAGTASGDFLLAVVTAKHATVIPDITCSGWTRIGRGHHRAAVGLSTYAFYKFAGGGETDPTFNNANSGLQWAMAIAGYTGVDTTTPVEQTPFSDWTGQIGSSSAVATIVPRLPRTRSDNAWMVTVVGTTDDNALALSVDQGFTLRIGGATYDINAISLGVADLAVASQGAVTAPTWNQTTQAADDYACLAFSLRESGATPNASHIVEPLDTTMYYRSVGATSTMDVWLPNRRVGDLMLMDVVARTNVAGTFTVTGWTRADTVTVATQILHETWYRFCDGSEADSLTVTYSTATTIIAGYSSSWLNVDDSDPFDPAPANNTGSGTATMTPAAVTTTVDGSMIVTHVWTSDNNNNALTTANSFVAFAGGTNFDADTLISTCAAYMLKATAGLVTMPVFTQVSNANDPFSTITIPLQLGPEDDITGTGASTLDGVTSAGSGTFTPAAITGTGASTLAGVTSAGAGTYTPSAITGTGSSTLDGVTSAGAGTYTPAGITGTGASTLDGVTSTGSGFFIAPITGTGSSTLAGVTSQGTGLFASSADVENVTCGVDSPGARCSIESSSAVCGVEAPSASCRIG